MYSYKNHTSRSIARMVSANILFVFILFVFGCAKQEEHKPDESLMARRAKKAEDERVEAGKGKQKIPIVSLEAEELVRITSSDEYDSSPCWSPDGKMIAYSCYRNGAQNIWVIDVNADESGKLAARGEPTQITTGAFIDQDLDWSPDGESIIFSSNRSGGYGLFMVKLADSSVTDLEQRGIQPRWSPEGGKIVYVDMNNIWTIAMEGTRIKQFITVSDCNECPCWSPDEERLIFFSKGDLVSTDKKGSDRKQLTSSGWNGEPDWSREKDEVVFVSNRGGYYDLWKMSQAEPGKWSDPVQLTNGPMCESSPRWSPDGKWIAFQANYQGSYDIWAIPAR